MPRIQAITQQHALERQASPASSRMFSGMSGSSEGVPKMHPLTSNMGLAMRAGGLIHSLRVKTPRIKIPGLRLPRI
jgi:hypothetical protein